MSQNNAYIKFGRQIGYLIAGNIVIFAFSFIQLPVLTKGLGTSLYGTWSLIYVTISLLSPIAMLSLNMAIIRFLAAVKDINKIREDFFSVLVVVVISGILFSLLLFFLSGFLALTIFHDASAASYIKLSSVLVLLTSSYSILVTFFRMSGKIGLYTILDLGFNTSQICLIVLFMFLGYKISGVVTALIISSVALNTIALLVIWRQIGFAFPRFTNIKQYLTYSFPLVANPLILWIISASDRYIIGYFLGQAATGIYSSAYGVGGNSAFMLTPLSLVLFPTISKLYDEGNHNETKLYLKYSLKYLMMMVIPCAAGISILAKSFLQILTTSAFVNGAVVVPLIAFGAVFSCFYQVCIYIMHLARKTQVNFSLQLTAALVNIILNIVLIPKMGILGAALASFIAYGTLACLTVIISRKHLKFDLSIPFILKSLFAASIMTLSIWLLRPESIIMVIVSVIIGIVIYFGALLMIKGLSRQEIDFFVSFIRTNVRGLISVVKNKSA